MRAALLALVATGCLPSSEFRCDRDQECGAGGMCQATGFCSFSDASCGSMQRYGEGAGSLSGDCVGGSAPTSCPAGYEAFAGAPGHLYRRTMGDGEWLDQMADCSDDTTATARTYLAVPNDAAELVAITSVNGSNKIWLGISDRATEGMFVDVNGAAATFLPWKQGSPDTGNNEKDCVLSDNPAQIADENCDAKHVAVCECEE